MTNRNNRHIPKVIYREHMGGPHAWGQVYEEAVTMDASLSGKICVAPPQVGAMWLATAARMGDQCPPVSSLPSWVSQDSEPLREHMEAKYSSHACCLVPQCGRETCLVWFSLWRWKMVSPTQDQPRPVRKMLWYTGTGFYSSWEPTLKYSGSL